MSKLYSELLSKLDQYKGFKKLGVYICIGLLFIFIAVAYFVKSYFADKAALVKDKVEDDKADAKYKAEKAKSEAKKDALKDRIDNRAEKIEELHDKVEIVKKTAKNDREVIDSIQSWEDVDKKVRR